CDRRDAEDEECGQRGRPPGAIHSGDLPAGTGGGGGQVVTGSTLPGLATPFAKTHPPVSARLPSGTPAAPLPCADRYPTGGAVARAKRTDRAEARRRYRASQAAEDATDDSS